MLFAWHKRDQANSLMQIKVLRNFCEIVLDTSRLLRIISHIDAARDFDNLAVLVKGQPRLVPVTGSRPFYYRSRAALSHPQKRTAWFTGSAVSDDSQFFATAT
jgi:hypothetical protein